MRTDADILPDPRLHPLDEVAALAAADVEHLARAARRAPHAPVDAIRRLHERAAVPAPRHDGVRLARDEHALDPVVEALQAEDGRVLPLHDADLGARVVWGGGQRARAGIERGDSQCPAIRPTSRVRLPGLPSCGPSAPSSRLRFPRRKSCEPAPPVKVLHAKCIV